MMVPVTIMIPETFLSQLLSSGVQVQLLPETGSKRTKASTSSPQKGGRVSHPYKKHIGLFGGKTPSQLFEACKKPPRGPKRHLIVSEPCQRPGYLTASQLLVMKPSKVGKHYVYTADKDNLSPSQLFLAHQKEIRYGRPELFHGLTASQLLTKSSRQQSKTTNYKKYMSSRLYPTCSQLFLLSSDRVSSSTTGGEGPKAPRKPAAPSRPTGGKKKQQVMLQKMGPEPRPLLEPTPSLLLLKHLSMIPSLDQTKKAPKVTKTTAQRADGDKALEPLLYGF